MEPFDIDQTTLELLGAEHRNGTWIGTELLPIANRIRNRGGSEEDFLQWVLPSHLWTTYVGSTSDSVSAQRRSLSGVWPKSANSKPFELEEALSDLAGRIASCTRWPNPRSASRDRTVALAFVGFCIEHNCFTRTISTYELAKLTPGMGQKTVHRALMALLDLGLLKEIDRTDRRASNRSTRRYQVNLHWKPEGFPKAQRGVSTNDLMNTGKHSLSHELIPPHDVWSRRGLGPSAQRVFELLSDETCTARQISEKTGMSVVSVKRYLKILSENCLAGIKPGAPGEASQYFRVDTPLDAVADALGIFGHVEIKRWEIEQRQAANQAAYPSSYRKHTASS